jgi:SAM-dependent methyltransferase
MTRADASPAGWLAAARDAARAAVADVPAAALPAGMRALDEAALLAMSRALGREGLFRPGLWHRWDQVADRLRVAPRHRWLVRRWLAVLGEEGRLERDDAGRVRDLVPVRHADLAAVPDRVRDACRTLGYPEATARFFLAAARHLPALLRDEIAAQTLLFHDDDLAVAEGAYRENVVNRYLNAAAAELLRRRCATLPHPARVAELGAGIGGTTAAVLPALAGQPVDYLFTDVSRYFLDTARERFGDTARYALLDVNNPAHLGAGPLPAGSADIVLAANVLHNAVHVPRVLAGLRAALAPGGILVLIESCREHYQALTSMHFLMSAPEGRPQPGAHDIRAGTDRIFLTRDEWQTELARAGFSPLPGLPDPAHPLAALGQHLLAARAPHRPTHPTSTRQE